MLSHTAIGQPLVTMEVLATGLAGAVLGQLLLAGHIHVDEGAVDGIDQREADDAVTNFALDAIHRRSTDDPLPARWWVEYLRDDVYPLVGKHLTELGLVEVRGSALRRRPRYQAVDPLTAAAPRVRLRYHPEGSDRGPDVQTAVLAGLALATGLDGVVADAANRTARGRLVALRQALPTNMRDVVDGVDAAVTGVTLATPRGH